MGLREGIRAHLELGLGRVPPLCYNTSLEVEFSKRKNPFSCFPLLSFQFSILLGSSKSKLNLPQLYFIFVASVLPFIPHRVPGLAPDLAQPLQDQGPTASMARAPLRPNAVMPKEAPGKLRQGGRTGQREGKLKCGAGKSKHPEKNGRGRVERSRMSASPVAWTHFGFPAPGPALTLGAPPPPVLFRFSKIESVGKGKPGSAT